MGINGQIGSYLCEILHDQGYQIFGLARKKPQNPVSDVTYIESDLTDARTLKNLIVWIQPDEIYNMAAQTDAVASIAEPEETLWLNGNIALILCECVRQAAKPIKLFQANSMEIYKGLNRLVITEDELGVYPKNPYAIAKITAYWSVRYYREQHGCYVNNGIIFNAESPRRHSRYVTRKIANSVRQILTDPEHVLTVGDLDAQRDWIHAYDVAMAAWLSLQQPNPGDYVISLGATHSVREFIERSFYQVGITIKWEGSRDAVEEVGVDSQTGRLLVKVDSAFFRQYETKTIPIYGDNTKLRSIGWIPRYTLDDIIAELLQ
jgi:GDPmannose 4,6-dehydratase